VYEQLSSLPVCDSWGRVEYHRRRRGVSYHVQQLRIQGPLYNINIRRTQDWSLWHRATDYHHTRLATDVDDLKCSTKAHTSKMADKVTCSVMKQGATDEKSSRGWETKHTEHSTSIEADTTRYLTTMSFTLECIRQYNARYHLPKYSGLVGAGRNIPIKVPPRWRTKSCPL